MKRWIFNMALCLCVCLLVAGLCGRADAADIVASGECGDDVTWTLDREGTPTVSGSGEMGNPSWDSVKDSIKNVVIEDGVTSIGNRAFYRCTGLTSIALPNSVTSIEENAFYHCNSLTSITLPDSVTSIGNSAFEGCTGLKSATIGNNVESIGSSAFSGCNSLTSITIPDSVTSIGNSAFYCCTALTSITIPDSVTSIGNSAFYCCTALTSITIPDGVTSIGNRAFYWCTGLTSIALPNSVTSIGNSAFDVCESLTSITIPDGVTSIGDSAFCSCRSLTSITIPDSVTNIGDSAFYGCGLESIFFNGDAPAINATAFLIVDAVAFYPAGNTTWESKKQDYGGTLYWHEIDEINLSKGIVASGICGEDLTWQLSKDGALSIKGSGALTDVFPWESYKPMIREVSFADAVDVPTIPANSFSKCRQLRTVTLPDSVTSIGNSAFDVCISLTSITLPDGVTSISDRVFYGCESLTSITIPDGVTSIGDYAFSGCNSLTSITIPDSVTSIGFSAFSHCSDLVGIWVGTDNLNYSSDENGALYNKEKTELIRCPQGFNGAFTIPDSVRRIKNMAFYECFGLTSITIPDSVTNIESDAFGRCTGLTSITLPNSVKYIGSYAFEGCTGLTSITIPDGVASIGGGTFFYCSSLTGIWVGEGNLNYSSDEKGVLYNKEKTELMQCPEGMSGTYAIPNGVTSIGYSAFRSCSSLTSITIPDSVTSIESGAFYYCTALTSITIPDSVTSIGRSAFSGCSSLKVVVFRGEKPSISYNAFEDVTAIAYYPESLDSDSSWKEDGALSDYGGTLNWKPWYTLGNDLLCEHVFEESIVPPSCTWGYTLHKCTCGYSYRTDFEPGSGHDMITDAAVPATCTETGLTEGGHCSRCDYTVAQEITPALGHDYIDHAAKAATCTEVGWNAYQTCSRCDYTTYQEIPALGHDMIVDAAVSATCTETGLTEGSHCSRCDYKVTQTVVAAPGHDWGTPTYVWSADNSAITATHVCKRDTAHKETEKGKVSAEVTKEATYDAEGEITYTATFINPAFRTQVKTVTTPKLEETKPTENPFTDVGSGMYYTVPVLWAVENRVTAGTSATTFGPNDGCTRAQVVTFLWRAAGQPEPTGSRNPFTDVSSSAYYYKAVLWAVENGITAGTSATTFSPDGTCTRAQIVTFLWRYEGMPAPASAGNSFVDVPTGAYYEKAVLWAAQSNVTAGTSATTFSPDSTCTRAQVVTFLYRDVKK